MTFISHYICTKSFVSHFDSTVVLSVVEPNSVFNQLSEQCLIACRKRVSCSSCPTTSWQPSQSRTHPCRALQAKFALGSLKCLFSACCKGLSWSSSSRKNHARTWQSACHDDHAFKKPTLWPMVFFVSAPCCTVHAFFADTKPHLSSVDNFRFEDMVDKWNVRSKT